MAISASLTNLYIIDPDDDSVLKICELDSIEGVDATVQANASNSLCRDYTTYTPGNLDPGQANLTLNFDPEENAHVRLNELYRERKTLHWCIGFSDGTDSPKAETDGQSEKTGLFDLAPIDRTCIYFDGFMTSYSFGAAVNNMVSVPVGIQLTNVPELVERADG